MSGIAAGSFLILTFLIVFIQVMLNLAHVILQRMLGFHFSPMIPSYADFATYCFAAATFFGLGYTQRSGGNIRVHVLSERLGQQYRLWLELWCLIVGAGATCYLAYYAICQVLSSHSFGDTSSGLIPIPLWIPQVGMAAGLVTLAVALLDDLATTLLQSVRFLWQSERPDALGTNPARALDIGPLASPRVPLPDPGMGPGSH
jgi:TRAP-type C4-dicarboxylate transport system permease small subunit